jgi:hypothetical protein
MSSRRPALDSTWSCWSDAAIAPPALEKTTTKGAAHLDPGHRSIAVVQAPTIEAVAKLAFETGLSQWNTVEVFPVTPVAELMARVDEFPVVFE